MGSYKDFAPTVLDDSDATPSCVKTLGKYLMFKPIFKIPIWNLEASASSAVS